MKRFSHCKVIQSRDACIIEVSNTMRNSSVFSITLPPDLARQAERMAKKENRTMSELMREALRCYQRSQVVFDPTEWVNEVAPAPPELQAIREDAKRNGTDKLTMAQINREVAAVRRQAKKEASRATK
jgi:hypothetical protein